MSTALVCGKRSQTTFFEDEYNLTPFPSSKRIRCSSSRYCSPPSATVSPLERLKALFPDMERQVLERALEASSNDLDIAIKTLSNFHFGSVKKELNFSGTETVSNSETKISPPSEGIMGDSVRECCSQNQTPALNIPPSGSEWVDLIVREMSIASNIDDARARASRVLAALEKSIFERAAAEASQNFLEENAVLKSQVAKLLEEGDIWKRAFKTLHGHKEEYERSSQELHQLRLMMSQSDGHLKKLQLENYADSTWHMLIGSKDDLHYGTVLLYTTKDFETYNLLPNILHRTKDIVGMLECVDLYPVATAGNQIGNGLDMQDASGKGIKHVLKASMDDERHDYYAIGTFDLEPFTFVPDDDTIDVGVGLRYDYGKFYASKTFYDQEKKRRILWGYIGEVDSKADDNLKGWASIANIPRTILFDGKTRSNLLVWPVEELEGLRIMGKEFNGVTVKPGSNYHLDVGTATQLDIEAEFELNKEAVDAVVEADVTYNCSTSDGSVHRGLLGPFGLLVLANQELTEKTATYFYVSRNADGSLRTHFCQDELRSSKASGITKRVVGSTVPVLHGETFSLRILVDHSVVESFAMKGRAVATSRVYPTEAIYDSTRVFVFNNATSATLTAKSLKIWHMNSTYNHPFPGFPAP